jgi:hypothetical protein
VSVKRPDLGHPSDRIVAEAGTSLRDGSCLRNSLAEKPTATVLQSLRDAEA